MKTINLLREGRGLRYAEALPPVEEPEAPAAPAPRRKKGAGKAVAAVLTVALVAAGLWWYLQRPPQAPEPAAPAPKPAPTPALVEAPKPPPPPKPARFTADKLDRWFRSDLSYPFALVVASFRTEDRARAFALRLKKEGYPATVAPTDLGKRGRWFRVVLDRYPDIKEAREAARGLKGKKPLGKPWPAKLPFAVEVGRQEDPEAADKSLGELHQRGIMAWVFPEAAGPREPVSFVLLAGAFPTREQAEAYAQELRKSDLSVQVVSP